MTGLPPWLVRYGFIYVVAGVIAATGVVTAIREPDPVDPAAWWAWAVGVVLLASSALPGIAAADPRAHRPGAFAPRYGGLALAGMSLATALLALAALRSLVPTDADGIGWRYVAVAADFLAQVGFALVALLAYRGLMLAASGALRWVLGRFTFGSALAVRCTPSAIATILWLAVVGALVVGYLRSGDYDFLVWAAIFAPALLFARLIERFSFRTILSHLSLLGLAASGYAEGIDLDFDLAEVVGRWAPIVFYGAAEANAMFVYAIVGVTATLALQLKRTLVAEPADGTVAAALSIYPDSRTYVGDDGYIDRLVRLVLQSDGGVIGVTGLRGAGKSALLGAVMDRFRAERCVVWTVAPVSYQSDDKLSFLMSISRALCQKAIDDASGVLFGPRSETQRAVEEFIRSIRVPVAIGCLLVAGGYLLGGQFPGSAPLLGPPLSMPDRVQLEDEQLLLTPEAVGKRAAVVARRQVFEYGLANQGAREADVQVIPRAEAQAAAAAEAAGTAASSLQPAFEQARAAEVARLTALAAQIDAVLPPEADADGDRHAITPIPGEAGFDVVAGRIDGFDESVLVDRDAWLRRDTQVAIEDAGRVRFEESMLGFVFGLQPLDLHGLETPDAQRAFVFLQEEFERRVIGNRGTIVWEFDSSDLIRQFELRVGALAVLRGDPRLAPHLEGVSADLRRILRIDPEAAVSQGLIAPDWASLALLAAFYDNVAVLKDPAAAPEARRAALEALFLEPDRLRELRAVLARYVGVLEGRTLRPAAGAGGGADAAPGVFSLQNIVARSGSLPGVPFAWILGALLVLCLLPEIWRACNYVARGLLNFRVLVLMRECTEFMELLNYSEGREASAGFGFRGLSIAGKRTLSARNLTLQSLTDRYQGFVSLLLTFYNGKLIVIIDELDKMSDPAHVKNVLLELKGALFQRGCYYLISISEDAAAAFQGRMSEGRDIFESTFEDVLTIERMSPGAARAMVRRRLADGGPSTGLSDAAIDMLTVFSGAIPREIVRHLRETVLAAAAGGSIEPRLIGLDIFLSELRQWREALKSAPMPGHELIRMIALTEEIEAMLPARGEPAAPWPDLPSGSASAGVALAECLAILDPGESFMQEEIDLHVTQGQSADSVRRFRRLAELQSCLRLMTMNELMRHIWRTGSLDVEQSRAAVTCLRTIMIQPAVAARLLKDLAARLGLVYPERRPPVELGAVS